MLTKLNMPITYHFHCRVCQASEKLLIGPTSYLNNYPEKHYALGCCDVCKSLTHTTNNTCPTCGAEAKPPAEDPKTWGYIFKKFLEDVGLKKSNKSPFRLIPIKEAAVHSHIYCPKCKQMAVNALPVGYVD